MIEAKSNIKEHDFAADIASQHTPFIRGKSGFLLLPATHSRVTTAVAQKKKKRQNQRSRRSKADNQFSAS
jgi:hypothetical protein